MAPVNWPGISIRDIDANLGREWNAQSFGFDVLLHIVINSIDETELQRHVLTLLSYRRVLKLVSLISADAWDEPNLFVKTHVAVHGHADSPGQTRSLQGSLLLINDD